MKKSIFASTLIAASFALSVPALADGDGTKDSPLSGSISDLNPDSYTGTDGVVYIDGITSGYWVGYGSNSYTFVANINIGSGGITFNNGYSDSVYTFTGNITGNGNFTHTSGQSQKYTFTGSLAGYSGNITDTGVSGDKETYIHYGNGGTAATDTNVSGTGSVTVNGNITFNYSGYADTGASQAIAIANSSLSGTSVEFTGSVNYTVSSDLVGYNSSSTLTISNTNYTTTTTGSISGFGSVTVAEGSALTISGSISDVTSITVNEGSTLTLSGEVSLSDAIQNSGTVVVTSSVTFDLGNLTAEDGVYTFIDGEGEITGWGSLTSANFTLDGWDLGRSTVEVGTAGQVTVTTVAAESLTWAGADGATWSNQGGNWVNGSSGTETFYNGDSVTFGSHTSSEESKTVNISGSLLAGTITVSDNYTFVFSDGAYVEAEYVDVTSSSYTLKLQVADGGSAEFHMDGETFFQFFNGDENQGNIDIGAGVTFYLSDMSDSASFTSASFSLTGTGTLSVAAKEIGLYLPDFKGTVEFRSGNARFGVSNGNETGIYNSSATLQFDDGAGITLVGNTSSAVSAKLVFAEGSHTLDSGTATGEFSGAIDATNATITKSGSGTITFSGSDVNIGELDVSQGDITFAGDATIGTFKTATSGSSQGNTIALGENAKLTVGTLTNAWGSNFTLADGSVLTVTGTTSFEPGSTARTVSGSGTFNTEKLSLSNFANYTFSGITLNIGSGGIVSEGNNTGWTNNHLTFGDGLTVGVYNGESWSTDATITFSGNVTFHTEAGESITLSGNLTGSGFSNTGSGTLTLSGMVSLDSAISNSGTIVVNTGSVVFNLDNLTGDGSTYTIITNNGGTITNWGSLDESNFYISGSTITSVTVTTEGQVTITAEAITGLIWNGGTEGTWDTSEENWTSGAGGSATKFTEGADVWFDRSGSGTVTVDGSGVEAGSVTVTGGTYSFTGGSITLAGGGTFTINKGAEVDLDGSVVYGDVVVDGGTLKLDVQSNGGASGEIHGTITINDGGRVELDDGDATGYNEGAGVTAITINSGGTLYVGTTSNQTLGSCELILVGGTVDGVSGSNIDLYLSSKITVKAADGADADNPTVSIVKGTMLTPRKSNSGGTTEVFVDEYAVLDVQSGFWSGPNSQSSYNGSIEKTGAGTLEVTGYFAINNGQLLVDAGTVILSGYAGGTSNSYGFASAVTVALGANLEICFKEDASISNVSGAGDFTKSGSTTLTIAGYSVSGTTTVSGGTLVLTGETILGGSAEIHVETGATLDLTGVTKTQTSGDNTTRLDVLYIEGGTVTVQNLGSGWGGQSTNFGSGMYNYTLQISDGGVLEVTAAQSEGTGGGERGFAVTTGEGTYRYTGTEDSYIHSTERNIHLGEGATLIFDVVDSNATLDVSMAIAYGLASGTSDSVTKETSTGSLVKTGEGTLKLSGENLYSGGTTIKEGVLVAASSGALGSGTVKIEGGAQLSVSSGVTITNAISVTLSESNIYTVSPNSVVTTYAADSDVYAIIGDGGGTVDATVTIFLDEVIQTLLADAGEDGISFCLVDISEVSQGSNFAISLDEALQDAYNFTYDNGILWIVAAPEPSMFGIFAGLGTLGLVATRRRRRN